MKGLVNWKRHKHRWLMAFWFLNIPIVFIFDVERLTMYIAAVSIYANFVGHWSADEALRAELAAHHGT
jgi:hypothetical protein